MSEKGLQNPLNYSFSFNSILKCKCGRIHEYKLKFKNGYIIIFPCDEMKLIEFDDSSIFHEKCNYCQKEIMISRDYYENNENETVFSCENCVKKDKLEKRFYLISKNKDIMQSNMANKFPYLINNNGKMPENEFYRANLTHIQLLGKFVDYLIFLRTLYSKGNKKYKIISNFLDYSENLIDIAIKNRNIYDLYHFNKEAIIYSYCNDEKKRFLSSNFKKNYKELLDNCKKKKYLSMKMLEYIYKKYDEEKLVDHIEYDLMKSKYFKVKNIDIGKEIYLKASYLRINYLDFKSIISGLENDFEIINSKSTIIKLEEELLLDKYINYFYQIPAKFSIFRKSINLILEKILRNNQEKFSFILPSENIINSALYLISTIKKQLLSYKKEGVANSINEKLKTLQGAVKKYKNIKSGKDKIEALNFPIINFDD